MAHAARTSLPPLPPRSGGVPAQWLTARGRRASGVAAAPRSRAAGAPAARRRRALGGARACRAIQTSSLGAPGRGPPSRGDAPPAFLGLGFPTVDWVSMVFIEHMRTTVLPTGWRQDTAWIEPR